MDFEAALREENTEGKPEMDPLMRQNLNGMAEGRHEDVEVLPAVAPTLSLENVKPSFQEFLAVVDDRINQAREIKVVDEESQLMAVALVGEAKRIIKEIDATKKGSKSYKLAKTFLDNLNSFARGLTEKFEMVVTAADPKVKAYMAKVELERKKQEEAARKAAKELQDKIDAEVAEANRKAKEEAEKLAEEAARKSGATEEQVETAKQEAVAEAEKHEITAPTVAEPAFFESNKIARTDTGVAAFTKKPWVFEITDEAAVPRQFCSPDKAKIRDAIKQGVRQIAGCNIHEDTKVNYRT